jgi:hypothetical protein
MSTNLNEHHFNLVVSGLSEISNEFVDELKFQPSSLEIFEILSWGLKTCDNDILADVNPSNITALKPKIKKKIKSIEQSTASDPKKSSVEDLNDHIFVVANDFFADLVNAMKLDIGQAPTLENLCDVLLGGLHRCDDDLLLDVLPSEITGIKPEIRKQRKILSKVGDVVAIPAKNNEFFIACILTKNCFGTAYGFFEGTHKPRPISTTSPPPINPYPIYSDDEFVVNGKWQIITHDEKLLLLFPSEPEIYHSDQIFEEDPKIGPYGSGETASGDLRDLTKEEAEQIGLLSGGYHQSYLSEDLDAYLNSKLG